MDNDQREFLKLILNTDALLSLLLHALADDVQQVVTRADLKPVQVQAIVVDLVDLFTAKYEELVLDAVGKAGGLRAEQNERIIVPRLIGAGARNDSKKMRNLFSGYQEQVRQRFPVQRHPEDQKLFVDRVKTVRAGFQSTVYSMIRQGVNEGTDPRKLAYMIRNYVVMTPKNPGTAAYREAAQLRNRASTYVARGAPHGSVQFNTMRIVRTEMGQIYRQSVVDFYGGRPYLEGYDWLLANSHPRTDGCDGRAAANPYPPDSSVPATHPLCLCRWVALIMSQEKIKQALVAANIIN